MMIKHNDTVNRDMMMIKLHDMGIAGSVWHTIKNSYDQTKGRIKFNGTLRTFLTWSKE
jgi:hypothetical protein